VQRLVQLPPAPTRADRAALAWWRAGFSLADPVVARLALAARFPSGGGALDFDGADDKVSFGDIAAIDGATALTVCEWYTPTNASAIGLLCGKAAAPGSPIFLFTHGDWAIGAENSITVGFVSTSPKGKVATVFSAGALIHCGFVYDGGGAANADRLKILLNAVDQTVSFTGTVPTALGSGTDPVTVGATGNDSADLDGWLAHLKIWTAALTAAEVAQEMNSYRPVRTANLVVWSPLDDGVSARDYSGNGNHGTVTGAVQIAGPPVSYGSE